MAINVFYSYSHADESHRKNMEKFLSILKSENIIDDWCDRKILAGANLSDEIKSAMQNADIVIFLVSIDFLSSKACKDEWLMAKGMNKKLVSVIIRECPWRDFDDMSKYSALPTDGKPIMKWLDQDEAWHDVYLKVKELALNMQH